LEHLEALEPACVEKEKPFPVQTVIRPKQKNTTILEAMPENCMGIISKWRCGNGASLTESVVTNIHFFDKQFEEAAVVLRLPELEMISM
jgi:sulfate adenylyltransferase subunit 1